MIDPKAFTRGILLALLFLGIGTYAFYRSRAAIFGITITSSIADGATLDNPTVPLTGTAKGAAHFSVNGRDLLLDKDGNFADTLLLQSGYTIIELKAQDRFGRTKSRLLHLYTKPVLALGQSSVIN